MKTLIAGALSLTALFATGASAQVGEVPEAEGGLVDIAGELIVCLESDAPIDLDAGAVEEAVGETRMLLQWRRRGADRFTNVMLVRAAGGADLDADSVTRGLRDLGDLVWTSPNRAFIGDPRELIPNDPQYGAQYHHPLMQNDLAWDLTLGDASVVVAVTDDGVAIGHEDLASNIWTNTGEIPGDGFDNDFNGYVDDVQGWDVLHGNNDPNPNGSGDDHGTHVAGIAAAATNNAVGVAGTAGAATIMPVQFFTAGEAWTAAVIAEAFTYAVDNGAQIISTSYNIDGWVGDATVTAAFDYLYDAGVLHFNSAGNGGSVNPARQAFHQTLLVANTDSNDVKSGSSNSGTGVDIAAPGSSILSTILNDGYGTKSGTSMAAPNAAGVAALVWSMNPSWTRDQVAAQVVATADNIDAQNPAFAGLLGGGRVNSFRALTETLSAPRVQTVDGLPNEGSTQVGDLGTIVIRFDQIMSPDSLNAPGAFRFEYAGSDGVFDTADDEVISLDSSEYLISSNEILVTVGDPLPGAGAYRFSIIGTQVNNPFGIRLDGNGDGVPGDSWIRHFDACATIVVSEDLLESGAGWSVENIAIEDGAWDAEPSIPVGGGDRYDPPTDFDGSGRCFMTDNVDDNSDVDGGPTRLTSYALDLAAEPDPYISYARWYDSDENDPFTVEISNNDGASWALVETVGAVSGWQVHTFRVADFAAPTAQVRLRFTASDNPNDSVVEAAVDHLRVVRIDCTPPGACPADFDDDAAVGFSDLLSLLSAWGPCAGCPEDLDESGDVGFDDLLAVLAAWGPCE